MRSVQKFGQILVAAQVSLAIVSCGKVEDESSSAAAAAVDLESAYFSLNGEVEQEVLGTPTKSRQELRQELLKKADTDGDGVLSEAEKIQFQAEWQALKEQLKAELIARLDTDKDGVLSSAEIRSALKESVKKLRGSLFTLLKDMWQVRKDAKLKIREACAKVGDAAIAEPATPLAEEPTPSEAEVDKVEPNTAETDVEQGLAQCKAVKAEEKSKIKEAFKAALQELKDSFAEIKEIISQIKSREEKVGQPAPTPTPTPAS